MKGSPLDAYQVNSVSTVIPTAFNRQIKVIRHHHFIGPEVLCSIRLVLSVDLDPGGVSYAIIR